jgi:hypothetical protein
MLGLLLRCREVCAFLVGVNYAPLIPAFPMGTIRYKSPRNVLNAMVFVRSFAFSLVFVGGEEERGSHVLFVKM